MERIGKPRWQRGLRPTEGSRLRIDPYYTNCAPTGDQMKRREFIALIGGAAAWPFATRAQQSERMKRVGMLMSVAESDPEAQDWLVAFREGLQQLGWTDGRNIQIDYRWASPVDAESRQRLGKELVALQPDLIL